MCSFARQGAGPYFTDVAGLIASEGKKMVPYPVGETYRWKPCKRSLSEPGSQHYEKPEGLKLVEQHCGKVFSIREKRHIRQGESKEEVDDKPNGAKTVYRDNGLRAGDQPAKEVDIQMEMQRKVKPNDMHTQRNGIGVKSLGDKAYRHPEYMSGFAQAGGLIIGSTFARGHHKKTEARNAVTLHIGAPDGARRVRSYAELQQEREALEAMAEVEDLTRADPGGTRHKGTPFMHWEASVLKENLPAYVEPLDSDDEGYVAPEEEEDTQAAAKAKKGAK